MGRRRGGGGPGADGGRRGRVGEDIDQRRSRLPRRVGPLSRRDGEHRRRRGRGDDARAGGMPRGPRRRVRLRAGQGVVRAGDWSVDG